MTITMIQQPFQTFQIQPIPFAQTDYLDDNKKVDIVVQDPNGQYYNFTGDKISLQELYSVVPALAAEVQMFDKNQDNFLTEDELKKYIKKPSTGERITCWALGSGMVGSLIGSKWGAGVGAYIGAKLGLSKGIPGIVVGLVGGALVGVAIGGIQSYYDRKEEDKAQGYLPETIWNPNRLGKTVR